MATIDVRKHFFSTPVSSSQNETPVRPSVAQPPQKPGLSRRLLTGIASTVKSGLSIPLSIPGGLWNAGKSTVGAVKGSYGAIKKTIEIAKHPQKIESIKDFLNNTLLSKASTQIRTLNTLLHTLVEHPENITFDIIKAVNEQSNILIDDKQTLVALGLNEDGIHILESIAARFKKVVSDFNEIDPLSPDAELLKVFKQELSGNREILTFAAVIMAGLQEKQQGALINAVLFLQKALLDPTNGLLEQFLSASKNKVTHDLIPYLLNDLQKQDGMLSKLQARLTVMENDLLTYAIASFKEKVLGEKGLIDALKGKCFEQDGMFDLLRDKFVKEGGIIDGLRDKFTKEGGFIDSLSDKLTKEGGLVDSLSDKLTKEGGLVDRLRTKLTEKNGLVDSLGDKLTNEGGLVDRVRGKLTEKDGLVDSLGDQFTKKGGFVDRVHGKLTEEHGLVNSLSDQFTKEGGVVDKVMAKINEKADPLLKRIENLPKVLMEQFFGKPAAPADSAETSPAEVVQEQSAGGWLSLMSGKIKTMLSGSVKSLSKETIVAFASVLAFGIQQIHEKIKDNTQCEKQTAALLDLLGQIQTLKTKPDDLLSNLKALGLTLSQLSVIFNSVKIYVNGVKLPVMKGVTKKEGSQKKTSPEAVYYKSINTLRAVNSPLRDSPVTENWYARSIEEKEKFIDNLANLGTVKLFYEIFNDKGQDFHSYLVLLDEAKAPGADLTTLVLDDLKKKNISWGNYILTWLFFSFVHTRIRNFIKDASNGYFEELSEYIQQQKQKKFRPFTKMMVTNSSRYLGILNKAFRCVASTRHTTGLIEEMIKKEMELPALNQNQSVNQIYAKFIDNALRKGAGNGLYYRFIKWMIGNQESNVGSLIDTASSNIQDIDGYPHAINTFLSDLLNQIWVSLNTPSSPTANDDPSQLISKQRKRELSTLVKNLFEVVRKSKCQTFEELETLIQGKSFSANANKAIDDLFINDVIERVSVILGASINTFAKEEQLQKFTFNLLDSVNNSVFNIHKVEPTREEVAQKESEVQETIDNILRHSISQAIKQNFESGNQEQQEVNAAIDALKQNSKGLLDNSRPELQKLLSLDYASTDAQISVRTLLSEALLFQTQSVKAQAFVNGSKWNEDNRKELLARHLSIAEPTAAFTQRVAAGKIQIDALQNHAAVTARLEKMLVTLDSLDQLHNKTLSEQALNAYIASIQSMQKDLKVLISLAPRPDALENIHEIDELSKILPELNNRIDTLSKTLKEMQKAQDAKDFALNMLSESEVASPLKQYLSAKNAHSSQTSSLFATLKQKVKQIIPEGDKDAINNALERLNNAPVGSQQEQLAKQELHLLLRSILEHSDAHLKQGMQLRIDYVKEMNSFIHRSGLLDTSFVRRKKEAIHETLEQSIKELEAFGGSYEDALKEIPFVNFAPIDMSEFKDWAKKVAYSRAKERTDGLTGFVSQKYTLASLLNHLVFLPYNEHEKGKEKKTGFWDRAVEWISSIGEDAAG